MDCDLSESCQNPLDFPREGRVATDLLTLTSVYAKSIKTVL